ncbi:MAG TPA: hypothetical protein VI758_13040 [Bacteroidota bacterium]
MFDKRLFRFSVYGFSMVVVLGVFAPLHSQPVIRNIYFDRSNVFNSSDSTTPGWFKSVVNTIHVTSREGFLRNEILFRENDRLQPALLAESERKLRRLYFMGDVSIQPVTEGDTCDVIVRTHDYWSLTTNASYKDDGGFQSYALSLSESNFLGTGDELFGGTDYSTARSKKFGSQFFFVGKHFPFQSWELMAQYKAAEELTVRSLGITQPFFSEESRWSFGAYIDDGNSLRRVYADGLTTFEETAVQQNQMFWGIVSLGSDTKYRIGMSYMHRTTGGVITLTRSDDQLSMAEVSFGLLTRSWTKTTGLNTLTRVEDVPTGFALDFIAGRNFVYQLPSAVPDYLVARAITAVTVNQSTYLSPAIQYTRTALSSGLSEATLQYTFLAHHRLSSSDLIIFRTTGTNGYRWLAGEEIILGSPTGLRGYDRFAFAGTRMLLFNLESRHVFPTPVWIFNFGAALFADCGTVWNDPQELARQRFHSAVGIGFRIENMKQQGLGLIRIDIPYSLDQRKISSITITSTHFLTAFADFDNIPPHF